VGGVNAGNLRLETCGGKLLLQIEIAVSTAVEGRGGRQLANPYEIRNFCKLFRFYKCLLFGCALCMEYFNVFKINLSELLELAAIDFIAVITATHDIVTQYFEGPYSVLIVSYAASSLCTRSFYVSSGFHK
jgi:hypothetical protein